MPLSPNRTCSTFSWPHLIDACSGQLKSRHGLQEAVVEATREDHTAGAPCVVLDPKQHNEAIYATRSFEIFTGLSTESILRHPHLECLHPSTVWLDDLFNSSERHELMEFYQSANRLLDQQPFGDPVSLTSLFVGCKRLGDPFWFLLHTLAVSLKGAADRPRSTYILHILLPLDVPVPDAVWQTQAGEARLAVKSNLDLLKPLIERSRQDIKSQRASMTAIALSKVAENECQELAKILSDAFHGTRLVPRLGRESVSIFEQLGRREQIFTALEASLRSAWEVSEEAAQGAGASAAGEGRAIACSVADPCGEDCPLVYISRGFEELTGYTTEWTLGRNCRFLQPQRCSQAPVGVNKGEVARMQEFCKARKGTLITLLLNETKGGELFWNLLFMEYLYVGGENIKGMGRQYIFAVQTSCAAQAPDLHQLVLSHWETGVGSVRLQRLRELFKEAEASFYPREQSLLALSRSIFDRWFSEVSGGPSAESSYQRAGSMSIQSIRPKLQDFSEKWPALFDKAVDNMRNAFRLAEKDCDDTKSNLTGGIVCCVADPSASECPLVYVSQSFEDMTEYSRGFAIGRNCRFLQPSAPGLNSVINGEEVDRMRKFCSGGGGEKGDEAIVCLLLNERRTGGRFWNLLHMQFVTVDSTPYILGVQSMLEAPMPAMLRAVDSSEKLVGAEEAQFTSFLDDVAELMSKLRPLLNSQGLIDMPCAIDIATRSLVSFLKERCTDYEGDHWVPCVGLSEVSVFQKDMLWKSAFNQMQSSLYKVWEVSQGCEEEVACAIADPKGEDCPLVYVSPMFEVLTGYNREFSMGRNCRFLQPNEDWFNTTFNKNECREMKEFCAEPQPKGARLVSLLVNERKDGYPFLNLLIMEHIEVTMPTSPSSGTSGTRSTTLTGPWYQRSEKRPYIFGAQTALHTGLASCSLVEVLAADTEGLKHLARLRQMLRNRERTLAFQSLQTFARECLSGWLLTAPAFFSPPRARFGASSGWARVTIPTMGMEVTAQNILELVPTGLEEGVRHFYLTFAMEDRQKLDRGQVELQGHLLALRLAELLKLLELGHYHYLRSNISFTLLTPPHFISCQEELGKAMDLYGYVLDCWVLDMRGRDTVLDCLDPKVVNCWLTMSAARRSGGVGALGIFGAGREFCEKVQGLSGAAGIGMLGIEHYPGKVVPDIRERAFHETAATRGVMVVAYNIFGPGQCYLDAPCLLEEAERLYTDPAVLLMKWAESQGHATMATALRALPPRKPREKHLSVEAPAVGSPNGRQSGGGAPARPPGVANFHRTWAKEFSRLNSSAVADFFRNSFVWPDTSSPCSRRPSSPGPRGGPSPPKQRRRSLGAVPALEMAGFSGAAPRSVTDEILSPPLSARRQSSSKCSGAGGGGGSKSARSTSSQGFDAALVRGTLRQQQQQEQHRLGGAAEPGLSAPTKRANAAPAPPAGSSLQDMVGQLTSPREHDGKIPQPPKEQRTNQFVRRFSTPSAAKDTGHTDRILGG